LSEQEVQAEKLKAKITTIKNDIKNDDVKIGDYTFKINRNMSYRKLSKLTVTANEIEKITQKREKNIFHLAEISDKWLEQVFNECLLNFKEECLEQINQAEAHELSSIVFLAVRTGIPFLALRSPEQFNPPKEQKTTSQQKTSNNSNSTD